MILYPQWNVRYNWVYVGVFICTFYPREPPCICTHKNVKKDKDRTCAIEDDPADHKTQFFFFFFFLGYFHPLCVRSPLDTLESGVLFHIWWLSTHLFVLHDKSAMESSVVSSLPDVTFTPTPRKHGVERSTMKHSSNLRSPFMWVILLIIHHQLSYLRENWPLMECGSALDEPFFGMPTRIRVMGRTS